MKPWTILSALLALAAPAAAQEGEQDPATIFHTRFTVKAEPATVRPGDFFELVFDFKMDPQWHIYSANGLYSPTEWTILEGPVERAEPIVEPKPKEHRETIGGTPFNYDYHEGQFQVRIGYRLSRNAAAGPLTLKGKMTGQECDPNVCIVFDYPFEAALAVEKSDLMPLAPVSDLHTRIQSVRIVPAKAKPSEAAKLEFTVKIDPKWHIASAVKDTGNRTRWVFDRASSIEPIGPVEEPEPHYVRTDLGEDGQGNPAFLESWNQEGTVTFRIPVRIKSDAKAGDLKVAGTFIGQECSNVCVEFEIPFTEKTQAAGVTDVPAPPAPAPSAPVPPSSETPSQDSPRDLLGLLTLAVIGGLVSLVMPCVYPLLPITLTYFIKQGGESRAKSVAMSTAYALGIIIVFTGVGFLFSTLLGAEGPRVFAANAWVNIAVALLFFWFAFSLFGLYEITLPSWLMGSVTSTQRSGVGGAFILGALFSIVTFTCTIPIAATILGVAATSGAENRFAGLLAMFVYSATMAVPFFILGLFPTLLKEVPKSGGWLHTVKITAGFAELALALLYLAKADQVTDAGVLTRPVMIAIWVAVLALMSLYLLGVFRMKGDDPPGPVGLPRALVALAFIVMAVYMGSGFSGRPLGELDILLPVNLESATASDGKSGTKHVGNYDDALALAKKEGKPIFLEFTGVT